MRKIWMKKSGGKGAKNSKSGSLRKSNSKDLLPLSKARKKADATKKNLAVSRNQSKSDWATMTFTWEPWNKYKVTRGVVNEFLGECNKGLNLVNFCEWLEVGRQTERNDKG